MTDTQASSLSLIINSIAVFSDPSFWWLDGLRVFHDVHIVPSYFQFALTIGYVRVCYSALSFYLNYFLRMSVDNMLLLKAVYCLLPLLRNVGR